MRLPQFRMRTLMIVVAVVGGECAFLVCLCRVLCGHTMPVFFHYGPSHPLENGEGAWIWLNALVLGPIVIAFWPDRK